MGEEVATGSGDMHARRAAGDPLKIPAESWNYMLSGARRAHDLSQAGGAGQSLAFDQADIVFIANGSGADRDRFDVLGIDGPLISPTDNVNEYGKWAIVRLGVPTNLLRFELKETLQPGSWAAAYPYDAGVGPDTAVEVDVFDAIDGTLRGRGRTSSRPGTHGYARFMADSGHWEIITMEHQARRIRFALKADMGYGSGTGSGDVLSYWDGFDPDPDDDGVTVGNLATRQDNYLFAGTLGAVGIACLDPLTGLYHIVQMECP